METGPLRRLVRSRHERMVAGVCGGLGRYFDTDPVIWRLGFVLVTLMGGAGLLAYIILAIVLPEEGRDEAARATLEEHAEDLANAGQQLGDELTASGQRLREDLRGWSDYRSPEDTARRQRSRQLGGMILIGLGALFLLGNMGIFAWVSWDKLWPAVLIVIGLALLLRQRRD